MLLPLSTLYITYTLQALYINSRPYMPHTPYTPDIPSNLRPKKPITLNPKLPKTN